MGLDAPTRRIVDAYRAWVESTVSADLPLAVLERHDREDGSTLASRWKVDHRLWYEIAVRPFLPQVRVAMLTDDPWRSRDFEQMIEASSLTLEEFVAQGIEAAGLAWRDPPVEHYCEWRTWFYFATPLDLKSIDLLADEAFRQKTHRVLMGYHHAFSNGGNGSRSRRGESRPP